MDAHEYDWPKHMVKHGLWEAVEGGYHIHDYLDWNISKKQYEKLKKKLSSNGKKGANRRWHQENSHMARAMGGAMAHPMAPLSTSTSTLNSSLSSPNLTPDLQSKRQSKSPIPETWCPNEQHLKLARARNLDLNIEALHFKGKAQEQQWVTKDWDLKFTNWMLQEIKFRQARRKA